MFRYVLPSYGIVPIRSEGDTMTEQSERLSEIRALSVALDLAAEWDSPERDSVCRALRRLLDRVMAMRPVGG